MKDAADEEIKSTRLPAPKEKPAGSCPAGFQFATVA
jgi:hypothetical protein